MADDSKRRVEDMSTERDGFDHPEPYDKQFLFDVALPADREVDFGAWHVLLREKDHSYRVWYRESGAEITEPFVGVTSFAESMFPQFDADGVLSRMRQKTRTVKYKGLSNSQIKQKWKAIGDTAACLGTQMHSVMEVLLSRPGPYQRNFHVPRPRICAHGFHTGVDGVVAEDAHVHALLEEMERRCLVPIALEQCVYIPQLRMTGTIDAIFRNSGTGRLEIWDWKRRPEFTTGNNFDEYGLPETAAAGMPKCHLSSAAIQLHLYREAWRREMGEAAAELHIVSIHPSLPTFIDHPIPIDEALTTRLVEMRSRQITSSL
jgi:hypothetical protein